MGCVGGYKRTRLSITLSNRRHGRSDSRLPRTEASLSRRLISIRRDGDIEGRSPGHLTTIPVVDRPFFQLRVVHGTYWMVVVDTPAASGIPVLRDRECGVGFAVGQLVIEVGVVAGSVQEFSVVYDGLGRLRNLDPKGGSTGHRHPILVEDRPPAGSWLVPDTDVVIVGISFAALLTRHRRDHNDGVRVSVYAGIADVRVISVAVRVGSLMDEGSLVIRFVGAALGRLRASGGLRASSKARRLQLAPFERAHLAWADMGTCELSAKQHRGHRTRAER